MKKIALLFSVICLIITCKAQPSAMLSTKSKKAEKAYNMAIDYAQIYDYENAYKQLAVAKKEDPNFVEAYTLEANLLMSQSKWADAVDQFKKAFSINPTFFPSSYYDCGNAELKLGRYADAKKDFQTYLDTHRPNASPATISNAQQGINNCDFALNAQAHPVPFNPINMGEAINGAGCEYFPNVTADDGTFLFTRNEEVKNTSGVVTRSQEDFYISYKDDNGKWSLARNLGPTINTPDNNEGAPSLSADGRFLFFAACAEYDGYGNGRVGFGSCDIFFSQKVNGVWSKVQNVGSPVNGPSWDSQPSFSSDGKTLYFISRRKGGYGGGDIWMAVLGDDGKWGPAINLGAEINTDGNEEAVFIHPDNQTLYFASDGLTGMGGLDLFVCRRDTVTGKWGKPTNLGYPINTEGDESGMIVNGGGQVAYFSSDRKGTLGCDDIYMFSLPKEFQPVPVTYMKGKTFNKNTLKPVGNASFELINLATGKTVITSFSDAVTGEFLVCLPVNENYALNVNAAGYTFYSETFQLKKVTDASKPFRMDVPLQPIQDSTPVELKNVFFATAKYDLQPESKAELNKLVTWMKTNPKVKIELGGHTDNVGEKKSNLLLSTNRAKAVYDYLVANGVEASRMTYKGYGDTKPKVANDTPEHRQMNRRTEFKVTSAK
jgi:outer membrane protein OmpA-like peptidoglycan-associated protein